MSISPKALYNSLRMNYLQNPSMAEESWKVADYRAMSTEALFQKMQNFDFVFEKVSFLAFADAYDSPEELFDHLVSDSEEEHGELYLIVFELWRRLANDKQSVSIICDELDHQIFMYDQGEEKSEELEDALASFHNALEENVDQGLSRDAIYDAVAEYLANDVQSFMIDYLSDLIDHQDYAYAEDLLEKFYPYMPEKKWFDLLHARIIGVRDIRKGHELVAKLFRQEQSSQDIEFNLDVLAYLISLPDHELFRHVAMRTVSLVETEDELLELIHIAGDIFHSLDMHEKGMALEALYEMRKNNSRPFSKEDKDLISLKNALT